MRQRNDTGHVQDVSAWPTDEHTDLRPRTVGPGEEIDHPALIGGFTSLEPDPEPEPDPDAAEQTDSDTAASDAAQPAAKPSTRKNAKSAAAASTEGGEQS